MARERAERAHCGVCGRLLDAFAPAGSDRPILAVQNHRNGPDGPYRRFSECPGGNLTAREYWEPVDDEILESRVTHWDNLRRRRGDSLRGV